MITFLLVQCIICLLPFRVCKSWLKLPKERENFKKSRGIKASSFLYLEKYNISESVYLVCLSVSVHRNVKHICSWQNDLRSICITKIVAIAGVR